jgi:predicted Ser/Thr protein kinase
MIYLAICFVVVVVALSYLIYDLSDKIIKERKDFDTERQILLNRIENPSYRPPLSPAEKRADLEKIEQLREETEQFGLVGKIID